MILPNHVEGSIFGGLDFSRIVFDQTKPQKSFPSEIAATLFKNGMVAGTLEKWPIAIERFQQALNLDPRLARAQLFLGRSLAEAHRFDEARDALNKAVQLGVQPEEIASVRQRLDDLEQGLEC